MPSAEDSKIIVGAAMVVTLSVVGYGFSQGWFSAHPPAPKQPEEPAVQFILDTEAPPPKPKKQAKSAEGAAPAVKVSPQAASREPVGSFAASLPVRNPAAGDEEAPRRPWQDPETAPAGKPASRQPQFGLPGSPYPGTQPGRGGSMPAQAAARREALQPASTLRYTGNGRRRFLDAVARDGKKVELDDGSVWEISDLYRDVSRTWDAGDQVSIDSGFSPAYPYRMANQGRIISVRLLKLPSRKPVIPDDAEEMPLE